MTNDCRDLEVLLSLRAAGALAPDEAARVEAHLAGCAECRAEADAEAEALALAKLPPLDPSELAVLRDLPPRALDALRGSERRSLLRRRFLAGFAIAASLALAVVTPALLRRSPPPAPAHDAASTEVAWQVPDVDAAWDDAGLASDEYSANDDTTYADTALAALEY